MTDTDVRREIVRVCRRLYERGLIAGPDGNVSVRISRDHVLITPRGFSKADVEEHDLVLVTLDGTRIGGRHEASSEIAMHLAAYLAREDVGAVVHAHPPVATGFAVAGLGLPGNVLPELAVQVGDVPFVPYATPGTEALPNAMAPWLPNYDAFLLANHGATTLGRTLTEAHQRMECVEHSANILLTARLLGRVNALGAEDARVLEAARRRTLVDGPVPGETRSANAGRDA
jgi:L-fuculose-phosphate aldolase